MPLLERWVRLVSMTKKPMRNFSIQGICNGGEQSALLMRITIVKPGMVPDQMRIGFL